MHTYIVYENHDGNHTVIQRAIQGGDYPRPLEYPDFVLAESEPGEPRIIRIPYTPPSLAELKSGRINDVDSHSIVLMQKGFTVSGVVFDILTDQERWKELMLAATSGIIPYPITVYGADKESSLALADLNAVKYFCGTYMTAREGVLAPGRIIKQRMAEATTKEELDAIIDDRT